MKQKLPSKPRRAERLQSPSRPGRLAGARLWSGLKLGLGLVGTLFFGLAALGLLRSARSPGLPVPGLLILLLLLGSVWLLRQGRKGLRRRQGDSEAPLPTEAAAPAEQASTSALVCKSCGARGVPDEKGCCEYCGGRIEEDSAAAQEP